MFISSQLTFILKYLYKNVSGTYTLPYVKQMTSENSMYEAGHPKLVLCDNPEGWDGVGGGGRSRMQGTDVYLWSIRVDVWQKPSQYCKVIIF